MSFKSARSFQAGSSVGTFCTSSSGKNLIKLEVFMCDSNNSFSEDVPDFGNLTKVKEGSPRNLFYVFVK